MSDKLTEMHLT